LTVGGRERERERETKINDTVGKWQQGEKLTCKWLRVRERWNERGEELVLFTQQLNH
jgi:hypothetical protein